MGFQEDSFPESRESDNKVHCSSGKVMIITEGSQQNLTLVLAKTY